MSDPEFEKTMQELAELDKNNPPRMPSSKPKAALAPRSARTSRRQMEGTLFRGFKLATNDFYALLANRKDDSKEVNLPACASQENFIATITGTPSRVRSCRCPRTSSSASWPPTG